MERHPEWLNNAVFYEIYPQSFNDTDSDGIGDINGIIEKLDYIRELGCNALWLNPCFESPFGDAGYDVSDYYKVAPRYGTNEDLVNLFNEAHKRNMHIILDLVPGHTSWEHPWFKESSKAEKNEYTDRYVWTDSIWEETPGYGTLRGVSERDGSCMVNFFTHQPALNYGFYKPERPWQQSMDSEGAIATRNELKNIMRFWLSKGCDGFRVDMAGSLVKNDEDGKGTIKLWQDIRSFLDKEFPETAMVSEWGEPDKSLQGGFHMDFLLHFGPSHYMDLFRCEKPFFGGNGDCSEFVKKYIDSLERSEHKGLICIPSGNHDMDRLSRSLHGINLKLAFAFILSMPGAPFIYYGDEIGMRYVEGLASIEGGYGRTGSRSPMQWNREKNAGFSDADADKLYIQLDPSDDRPDAESQIADSDSLRSEIKKLISVRMSVPALQSCGEISFIYAEKDSYPLAYIRSCGTERILVIINPSDKKTIFNCSELSQETIYSIGGSVLLDGQNAVIDACSAAFIRI